MPAISISFNRFLLSLPLQLSLIPAVYAQLPQFSENQLQWLGDQIFKNECNARFECLTSWNEGEDFPSLGIGHFIWFRANQSEAFEETFPALIDYYQRSGYRLPAWINELPGVDSPWQNRQSFLADREGSRLQELRQFLADTPELQSAFIVQRLHSSLPSMLAQLDGNQRRNIESSFYQIANTRPPFGIYALIDYVHFKGDGTKSSERYQGQGWGLLQVLLQMESVDPTLENFVVAAGTVLERRIANAPSERSEQRWINGWKNRLQGYLATEP